MKDRRTGELRGALYGQRSVANLRRLDVFYIRWKSFEAPKHLEALQADGFFKRLDICR